MDILDQKIINSLESQGYQKSAALAAQLGVGERTVRRRLNILMNKGLLRVVVFTNPILLGYRAWARIGIKVEPGFLHDVALRLTEHPSIYFITQTVGTFDIIIAARFRSMDRLTYFVNLELPDIQGIRGTEVFLLVWPRKYYHFNWPSHMNMIESDKNPDECIEQYHYELDEIDRRILSVLTQDGLISPVKLKSKLGMGESTIRQHLKKLSDNGVFKPAVVVNPEVLEYEVSATIGITINNRTAQELLDNLLEDPAVIIASFCIGRFNLIITARFHNIDSFNQFVNVKLANMEGISSVEAFLHTKVLKYHISQY